jgi:hypothetical protein
MFGRNKKQETVVPASTGTWPGGEPQSVRDVADREFIRPVYTAYMIAVGGYDVYEVVAVLESRDDARQMAEEINARISDSGICSCAHHLARVEEIGFYPMPPWLEDFYLK